MKICRRFYLTLLEIIIVIAILSLISGFIGFNVAKAVREQRFRSEVALVVGQIRLAQDLMVILGSDVHLKFAKEEKNGSFRSWIELDDILSQNWKREVKRPRKNFTAIRTIDFKDQLDLPTDKGVIDIKFLSGGTVMSSGILRLSTAENGSQTGTLERYICLPGYPTPLVVSTSNDDSCHKVFNKDQEHRLTQLTVKEINDKISAREAHAKKAETSPKGGSEKKDDGKTAAPSPKTKK